MKYIKYLLLFFCLGFTSDQFRPVHVFMIGDSTMSNKSIKRLPETGWGQVFGDFFNDSVVVDNYAQNGRSSKSFRDEGIWDKVHPKIKEGDYVFIQFGHNDNKEDPKRHTDPFTSYTANLEQYINETKSKGGIPVLCTSIIRRHFNENDELIDTHGDFIDAVKKVAESEKVYMIDLDSLTREVVEEMGPETSKQLYLFIKPGIYPTRPKGVADSTHLSQLGAYTFASLVVKELANQKIPLGDYLKSK